MASRSSDGIGPVEDRRFGDVLRWQDNQHVLFIGQMDGADRGGMWALSLDDNDKSRKRGTVLGYGYSTLIDLVESDEQE